MLYGFVAWQMTSAFGLLPNLANLPSLLFVSSPTLTGMVTYPEVDRALAGDAAGARDGGRGLRRQDTGGRHGGGQGGFRQGIHDGAKQTRLLK